MGQRVCDVLTVCVCSLPPIAQSRLGIAAADDLFNRMGIHLVLIVPVCRFSFIVDGSLTRSMQVFI